MSDDINVAVVNDPQIVVAPQPDIRVATETVVQPIVIESPEVETVTIEEDVHIVDEVRDIQVITVGEAGPRGAAGADGAPGTGAGYELPFAYGDATPAAIVTVAAGKAVFSVEVVITEPFDGTGASVVIGDAGQADRLMAALENDLSRTGSNTTAPAHIYAADTAVTLFISPGAGASAGKGFVVVKVQS